MNRRDFFKRLTTGAITTYVATALPLNWLPATARIEGLQMIMTKAFNEFVKGTGPAHWKTIKIFTSHKVFEQFNSEITVFQRFTISEVTKDPFPKLMFKSVVMYDTGDHDGFWFTITDATRTAKGVLRTQRTAACLKHWMTSFTSDKLIDVQKLRQTW